LKKNKKQKTKKENQKKTTKISENQIKMSGNHQGQVASPGV